MAVAGYFNGRAGLLLSMAIAGQRQNKKTLDSDIELYLSTEWQCLAKSKQCKTTDPEEAALYWSEHYEGVALSDGQTKASDLKRMRENGITSSKIL